MTGSYYLAGFWEIIQCSLQVIQYGFVSFRNSSSFCCISGFENFCRQYDTRIAGLCITRKFSEQAGQVKVEKCPQSIQFAYLNINFSSFQTGFLNSLQNFVYSCQRKIKAFVEIVWIRTILSSLVGIYINCLLIATDGFEVAASLVGVQEEITCVAATWISSRVYRRSLRLINTVNCKL